MDDQVAKPLLRPLSSTAAQAPCELDKLPPPLWLARDADDGAEREWVWRTLRS